MKKFLLLCAIAFSFSCEQEMTTYTINGMVAGVANGTEVRLQELVNNRPVVLARSTIENEEFTFTGSVEEDAMHYINIKGVQSSLPFILENAVIDMEITSGNLNNSVISGTKNNELLQGFGQKLREVGQNNQQLNSAYQEAQRIGNKEEMQSLAESFEANKKAQMDYEVDFVKTNKDYLMSVFVLERMMHSRNFSTLEIKELFDGLSTDLQQGTAGESVLKVLNPMLATAEGAIAPNFEAPNPEGKLLALNDITSSNEITIIDFWAAWCGPCRKENPNLVRLYEEYHDKGLEIVGVSLDGSSRQPDPKAAWLKAIKDDGLTWYQVSNLKYFEDPIAQSYSINAIPASFILDKEGKIIAKGLRGSALDSKIAELLD